MAKLPQILCITGPTASGKSALALSLAQQLGGEIVSADSMQVYRGMDIGTAKPSVEERSLVPHHMLDVCDPSEGYSAGRYAAEAALCVDAVFSRGRVPIVVGGTGMYINALLSGGELPDRPGDPSARQALFEYAELHGANALHARLAKLDPESAGRLHPNDVKRVARALEVNEQTGHAVSDFTGLSLTAQPRYDAEIYALRFEERSVLYSRIDRRVDDMITCGLLDEVRGLVEAGVPRICTAMQAIGYKELLPVLDGSRALSAAVGDIKQGSRRYAKRQLTWFRRDGRIKWLTLSGEEHVKNILEKFFSF